MTIDLSPEMQRKVQEAARKNLEAGDWVEDDPFLDRNDPPRSQPEQHDGPEMDK